MGINLSKKPLNSFVNQFRLELYQMIYWVGYFLLTLAKNAQLDVPYPWWMVLLADLLVIGIIYTIVLIFAQVYLRPIRATLVLAITFLLYSLLYYGLIYMLLPQWGFVIYDETKDFTSVVFLFGMFLYFHHAMVEAGLLTAIYRIRKTERQKRRLLEENHQTQVQFLTAQIDPHETANLLNIPYQKAMDEGYAEIAAVLRKVKERLLYVPENSTDINSEVALGEEVAQCDRIISLNDIRFKQCFVHVDIPEELYHWPVPVFSVSALLQNSFKYGVSWDEQTPIDLQAWEVDGRLTIRFRNKRNARKAAESSSQIGNTNIRRRLALLYGGRASLETRETPDGWYESILTITKL